MLFYFKRLSTMKKLYYSDDTVAYLIITGYFAIVGSIAIMVSY